jgi:hypothetical protein
MRERASHRVCAEFLGGRRPGMAAPINHVAVHRGCPVERWHVTWSVSFAIFRSQFTFSS